MKNKKILSVLILSILITGCNKDNENPNGVYLGEEDAFGSKAGFRRHWFQDEISRECKKKYPDGKAKYKKNPDGSVDLFPAQTKDIFVCSQYAMWKVDTYSDEYILQEWHKVFNPHLVK